MSRIFTPTLCLFTAISMTTALLASCGGSSGTKGSSTAGIDGSGAPATRETIIAVAGPINGFGSVIVNGVHYDTHSAQITINGQPSTEAGLSVGSYISLRATLITDGTSGMATQIDYQPNVSGMISGVNVVAESFEILGQTIRISDDTAFDFGINPRTISGIKVGLEVEISGATDANGEITATRVGLANKTSRYVTGKVSHLNGAAGSFKINGIEISYANLAGEPRLAEGQAVILRDLEEQGGQWRPKAVEIKADEPVIDVKSFSKTGVITRFTSASDFYVGDIPVTTSPASTYIGGDATALGLNRKVTVSGHFTADKRLQADKIQWLAATQWRLSGPISQVDGLTNSGGRIKVQDTWITLNPRMRLDSELSSESNRMKLANLRVGDQVVVSGRDEAGIYTASALEREVVELPEWPRLLRGTAKNLDVASGHFSLLNVQVETDGATEFFDGEQRIAAEAFYLLAVDKIVDVRGRITGNLCQANRVKLLSAAYDRESKPSLSPPPLLQDDSGDHH